mgnify:CR=1 FL=1
MKNNYGVDPFVTFSFYIDSAREFVRIFVDSSVVIWPFVFVEASRSTVNTSLKVT